MLQAASAEQRRVQVLTREDAGGGAHSREGTPAPEEDDEEEEEEEDDTAEVGLPPTQIGAVLLAWYTSDLLPCSHAVIFLALS